jgi:penicillin amidase
MADDGDYYRETLDADGIRYRRGADWRPVETSPERFEARGASRPVEHGLRYVRHEGVRCPLLSGEGGEAPRSFRWVGFEAWRGLDALLGMNRARRVEGFARAVEQFAVPAQNVVVADAEGTIAYFCAGRFPRRPQTGSGALLLDGACPDHAWHGYLPWAEHPQVVNPPAGLLVTANNRIAVGLSASLAGGFWEPPYRAARIERLLDQCRSATVASMAGVQADEFSLQAVGILTHVIRPVAGRLGDPQACRAAELLLAWDGRMGAASGAAALYHLFYRSLLERLVRPLFDRHAPALFDRYLGALHLAVPAVDRALLARAPLLFGADPAPAIEACLRAAWQEAVRRLGPVSAEWQWGRLHQLTLTHPAGRGHGWLPRLLAWLFRLRRGPFPRPGDGMTVNLGAFSLADPFAIRVGPSYRQIVDLGDPAASRWVIAGGASGDPRSPHYADQLPRWLDDEGCPMRFEGEGPGVVSAPGPAPAPDCMRSDRVL